MSSNHRPTKVLYVIAFNLLHNRSDKLPLYRELLSRGDLEPYLDREFLTDYISAHSQPDLNQFLFDWSPGNSPGRFIANQVSSPGRVVDEPITLKKIIELLSEDSYSHVVIAGYATHYDYFKKVATQIRGCDPGIKIIATANVALVPETKQLVDYCLVGDSVLGMREILGEEVDQPRKPIIIPSDTTTTFHKMLKRSRYGLLITGFGCRYGCDFCPSTAQWGRRENYPLSAATIAEVIRQSPNVIDNHTGVVTLSVAEPQGLGNPNWREVFYRCQELPFKCRLVTTTSSKVIQQYSINTLVGGDLHLTTVNIGVETLLNGGYDKNRGVDLKATINHLQEHGIEVVLTYLIGLPHQDRDSVLKEAELIKQLGASSHIVANLELQPGTPVFKQYQESGLTLSVPTELQVTPGYQAFRHPSFKSGFNGMLPLLDEVNEILDNSISALGEDPSQQDRIFQEKYTQIDLFHPYTLTTN